MSTRAHNHKMPAKWPLVVFSALGLATGFAAPLWAEDELEFFFARYKDDAGLTVLTPSVKMLKDFGADTTVSAKYTFERFDKEAPEGALDAVSGATTVAGGTGGGFSEDRHEAVVSAIQRVSDSAFAGGLFYGLEEDFASTGASVSYSRELLQKNLTLTGMLSVTRDVIETSTAEENKLNNSFTLAATQLLDARSLMVAGYSYANVDGYQSQPLRKIQIETTVGSTTSTAIHDESHPELRNRHTYFVRAKRYFLTGTSADLNLSYYQDDWGVSAYSSDLRLNQYFSKSLVIRFRYRFYSQGAADFYVPAYTAEQDIMTADTRLRAFDSHLAGLKWTYMPRSMGLAGWSLSAAYDRFRETNQGLTADIFKFAVRVPF